MNTANGASALVVNLEDFPDLPEALAGKGPGDKCKLTINVRIDELTGQTLRAAPIDVIPEGYTVAKEEVEDKPEGSKAPMVAVLREKKNRGY